MDVNLDSRAVAVVSVGCVAYAGTRALSDGAANERSSDRSRDSTWKDRSLHSSGDSECEGSEAEDEDGPVDHRNRVWKWDLRVDPQGYLSCNLQGHEFGLVCFLSVRASPSPQVVDTELGR